MMVGDDHGPPLVAWSIVGGDVSAVRQFRAVIKFVQIYVNAVALPRWGCSNNIGAKPAGFAPQRRGVLAVYINHPHTVLSLLSPPGGCFFFRFQEMEWMDLSGCKTPPLPDG